MLVNELNTIPGFTETSVYAKLFEATGLSLSRPCSTGCWRWRSSATPPGACEPPEGGQRSSVSSWIAALLPSGSRVIQSR